MSDVQAMVQKPELVLASASEARASLLRGAGVRISLCPSGFDEESLKDRLARRGHGAATMARRLAEEKALDVSVRLGDTLVLGGDQTLAQGQTMISKAADRPEAIQTLGRLAGRVHTLHAAFAFAWRGRLIASGVERATLRMRELSAVEITTYFDAAGPKVLKSVGCYQFEALGRDLFVEIQGDHSTILGLPLTPVLEFLRTWRGSRSKIAC